MPIASTLAALKLGGRKPRGGRKPGSLLHVDTPPAPPSGPGAVQIRAIRNDGQSGIARAVGAIQFKPMQVPAAEIAAWLAVASLWDQTTGLEVPFHISDTGARHYENGVVTSWLFAYVEVDATFASMNATPTFLLRFDLAPQETKQPRVGLTRYTNDLSVEISTDGLSFVSSGAFMYAYSSEDDLRAHPGGVTATWEYNALWTGSNVSKRTVSPTTGYSQFEVALCATSSGALRVTPLQYALSASAPSNAVNQRPQANLATTNYPESSSSRQVLGYLRIFVPAGVTYTLGVTDLRTPGIIVTTTTGTYKPYSVLPTDGPVAIVVPNDSAHLCASAFPGYALATQTEWNALGGKFKGALDTALGFADLIWRQEGVGAALDSQVSDYTTYAPSLVHWIYGAHTGGNRFFRRAVHYLPRLRRDVLKTTTDWNTAKEPRAEPVGHLVEAALTGDTSYLSNAAAMVWWCERSALVNLGGTSGDIHSGTGRFAKHALFGLAWAQRLGFDLAAVAPSANRTYTLVADDKTPNWINADGTWLVDGVTNLNAPLENDLRHLRMTERVKGYMKPDATQPANAGKRYMNLFDYSQPPSGETKGHNRSVASTWFMSAWILSELAAVGIPTFGLKPGVFEMIRDHMDFEFTGVSPATVSTGNVTAHPGAPRFGGAAGAERFAYYIEDGQPSGSGYGVMLNGCGVKAIDWLYQVTRDPVWLTRADTIVQAIAYANAWANLAYQQLKLTGEFWLHTGGHPLDRTLA